MADTFVSWIVDPEPWLVEHHLIRSLDVPLNLEGNAHNRFHRDLTNRRANTVARHARRRRYLTLA